MPQPTTTSVELPPGTLDFIQSHLPGLQDGDYKIKVTQTIKAKTDKETIDSSFDTKEWSFSVLGDRFTLKPQDIYAVFPPEGSLGEHSNVLPHIILNRSTLPWERSIEGDRQDTPWLALLLFHEEEKLGGTIDKQAFIEAPQIFSLKELKAGCTEMIKYPAITLETGQHDDDKVTVIDVPKKLLQQILPTQKELVYLAHVRKATDSTTPGTTTESAVIIGNRLPKKGGISTVHLVSLENRYQGQEFDYHSAGDNDFIRLVSLKRWSFACVDEKQSFRGLLSHLNRLFSTEKILSTEIVQTLQTELDQGHISQELRQLFEKNGHPLSQEVTLTNQITPIEKTWQLVDGQRHYCIKRETYQQAEKLEIKLDIYDRSSLLQLPKKTNLTENYLTMGYVPIPHHLRQGGKTVSWYHSPLLPGENPSSDNPNLLPSRAADALLSYNPSNGMFDISYAAAWELGRLLALQSKDFSINLYNWKRTHVQQLKQAEQKLVHPLTPEPSSEALEIPKAITDWFKDLSLLKGVPFNYLVPDERMLPSESIRFFWVDPLWIDCLLDGAFSIGRVATSDYQRDRSLVNQEKSNPDHPPLPRNPAANPYNTITGFLMRSDVVAGWPGLLVDASNEDLIPEDKQLKLLRMERLSPNVLLCLFAGEIKTVDIHQKPETLHFGLDRRPDDEHADFYKKLRDSEGKTIDSSSIPIPFQEEPRPRVVNITELVSDIVRQILTEFIQKITSKIKNNPQIEINQLTQELQSDIQDFNFKVTVSSTSYVDDMIKDVHTGFRSNPNSDTSQLVKKWVKNDQLKFTSANFALQMIEGVEKVRFASS